MVKDSSSGSKYNMLGREEKMRREKKPSRSLCRPGKDLRVVQKRETLSYLFAHARHIAFKTQH